MKILQKMRYPNYPFKLKVVWCYPLNTKYQVWVWGRHLWGSRKGMELLSRTAEASASDACSLPVRKEALSGRCACFNWQRIKYVEGWKTGIRGQGLFSLQYCPMLHSYSWLTQVSLITALWTCWRPRTKTASPSGQGPPLSWVSKLSSEKQSPENGRLSTVCVTSFFLICS